MERKKKVKILVLGARGQLGLTFIKHKNYFKNVDFIFKSKEELDIRNAIQLNSIFQLFSVDGIINCAAYTNVDLAETNQLDAYLTNVLGVWNLIQLCKKLNCFLIHYSSDFVFDGNKEEGYKVSDTPNPINYYGLTKYLGEQLIIKNLRYYHIIRTSWVFSNFGKNFYTTILSLSNTNKEIRVVNDQIGNPTSTKSLVFYTKEIIELNDWNSRLSHFTDGMSLTRFQWAQEILKREKIKINIIPVSTSNYYTKAIRPKCSILK